MRAGLTLVAAALALGGPAPAPVLVCAAALSVPYVVRSPDRLLDALYVALFCGIGVMVG